MSEARGREQRRLLLDVLVGGREAVLELLTAEDDTLQLRPLLVPVPSPPLNRTWVLGVPPLSY